MKDLFNEIKTRLLTHESDMDLDSAWASLQAHRYKTQKRNRLRLASVLLLLLWIGSCGSWIWVKKLEKRSAQNAQQQNLPAVALIPPVGQLALTPPNKPEEKKYHEDILTVNRLYEFYNCNNISIKQLQPNSPIKPHAFRSNLENVTRDIVQQPTHHFSHGKDPYFHFLPNTEPAISNSSDESIISVQRTDKTLIENNPTDLQTSPLPLAQATTALAQATGINQNLPPSLQMLPQRDFGLLASESSPLTLPTRYNTQMSEKSAKKKAARATAVYIGGGWLTTQQQFHDRKGQSAKGAELRKQTEQPLPSFTFHAGVQHWIGKGRLLDFGVHYEEWYDRLDYTFDKPHIYQYNNVLLRIRRLEATGVEVKSYGDTAVDGTQKVQVLYYNRYASINLRLALVQSIYQKGPWDIALGLGMNASLWAQADGLSSAPDPVQGTYELDKIYKKTFGVGINALTRLSYRFNEHYALQFTPSVTWGISNTLSTTNPLQSRLRQYSATAGIIYKF